MKRKILSLILILSMILSISSMTFATSPSIMIGNQSISLDEKSFMDENGSLMLPLRSIFEKLNYAVKWNDKNRTINLSKGNEDIVVKIDDKDFNVNGEKETISNPPIIREDRTFITPELLDKSLNSILSWNSKRNILALRDVKENSGKIFSMSQDKNTMKNLDDYMNDLVQYENFHGSVLIAKEGKILLNNGYGYGDFAQNIRNKSQTRFAIGSVTKQFAAFATLKLSEDGLLNVQDKLSKYIPDFPHGDEISIHHLLTHSSGLKNYTDLPEFFSVDIENKDPNEMLALIKDMPLQFNPGEAFQYSNTNYLAIGIIVEKISGESFEEYLDSIVKPLNMDDTGLIYGELGGRNDASPYVGYLEVTEIDDDIITSQAYAAGSVYSTVEDLYRWDRALKSGEILDKKLLEKIFEEHIPIPGAGSYGYGWMIDKTDMGKEIYHGGNTLGSSAYIGRLVESDIVIIILSNNGAYNTNDLKNTLTSIVLNKEYKMPEELKEIKIEDKNLYNKYTGKYDLIEGMQIDIFEKNNRLFSQATGQVAFEIYPRTTRNFFAKIADINFEFIIDQDGSSNEFILKQSGYEFKAKRVE